MGGTAGGCSEEGDDKRSTRDLPRALLTVLYRRVGLARFCWLLLRVKDGRMSSGRRGRGIVGRDAGGPLTFIFIDVAIEDVAVGESMVKQLCVSTREGMREGRGGERVYV
jgi:hypothetical protein